MKARRLVSLLCFALVILCSPAWSQPENGSTGWQRIQDELHLTATQMERLKPVLETYRHARHALFDTLSTQIRAVLSAQQQTRFDALRRAHHAASASPTASGASHGLAELITTLSLSPDQIVRIKDLVSDWRAKGKALHEEFVTQARAILSTDQFTQFEKLTSPHHSDSESH